MPRGASRCSRGADQPSGWLARTISWTFTVWEGLFPLALLDVRLAALFCVVASVFHFLVFRHFGLNRFFWAWMTTYPAILWCAGQSLG